MGTTQAALSQAQLREYRLCRKPLTSLCGQVNPLPNQFKGKVATEDVDRVHREEMYHDPEGRQPDFMATFTCLHLGNQGGKKGVLHN